MAGFLIELGKTLTITGAAERVGVSRWTIYLWMQWSEEFKRAV